MTTKEIIANINGNGGLCLRYISYTSRKMGVTPLKYIKEYIKASYPCSSYVAQKVAEYFN